MSESKFTFNEDKVTIEKTVYAFRELTALAIDDIEEKSKKPDGTTNQRAYLRFLIAATVVEPKVTVDDIAEWPTTKLVQIGRIVNRINAFEPDPTDEVTWLTKLGYTVTPPEKAPNS